jgi:predicted RNase H-like HicB family nuclease
MHRYETTIYWSNEDQLFIADVPELPGCMAHGDTPQEALAQAQEAMALWIETAIEFGDPGAGPIFRPIPVPVRSRTRVGGVQSQGDGSH